MGETSAIEWTDATWNVVTGCTKVSPGCDRCYAETFAERWRGTTGHHFERGFDLTLRPERIGLPLRWRRPRRVFVNSMSDLFHPGVPEAFIAETFAVMGAAHWHTFQLLTKRHARMRSLLGDPEFRSLVQYETAVLAHEGIDVVTGPNPWQCWPLPNVWVGVSAETQAWADIRLAALALTPAARRWVSCEPLLRPVDLTQWLHPSPVLDWVVVGGESGAGARPINLDAATAVVQQAQAAEVAVFVKQLGTAWARARHQPGKGGDPSAWPPALRVRHYPQPAEAMST